MSRGNEEVTPQRLVGLKKCNNSTARLSYFYTYERRRAKISDPFPLGGLPIKPCSPGQVSPRARSPVAPHWKARGYVFKISQGIGSVQLVTERFWKAGFSGSILPLEEGRDSTSASLNEDK